LNPEFIGNYVDVEARKGIIEVLVFVPLVRIELRRSNAILSGQFWESLPGEYR
jgi:hypothetical protein